MAILPVLRQTFAKAYVSLRPETWQAQPQYANLRVDRFFELIYHENDLSIGDDFRFLYGHVVTKCSSRQIVNLCFLDRVAFVLQTTHKKQFLVDVKAISPESAPIVFQRSDTAWKTHPANYQIVEKFVTQTGELLFGKTFDFAWCHLALTVKQLAEILPYIKNHDLSLEAEIVILLRRILKTKNVDWLAWEDPFIFSRDPEELKTEREQDIQENLKRLGYVMPMLQILYDTIEKGYGSIAK